MKFVCDRCKTRYSIGDERVRGKILKIRCKNCANVITVREGMDAGPNEGDRSRPTMSVPIVTAPTASGPVVVATKAPPPPAFEEEWYVSIDGVQSGPISLAEAQRWVASKPHDAELHCWKEGFDDWLPVEKVSHFRAHRRRPTELPPMAPPPPRKQPTVPPPLPEKPLFASTMAAIEKSATESQKMPAITNQRPSSSSPAMPAARSNGTGPIQAKGTGSATPISAGAAALKHAFSDDDDPADSATSVGAPAFAGFDVGGNDVDAAPATPAKKNVQQALEDDDDDLQIGEVSRVVKLADLMPKPKPANSTGSVARVSQTASVARVSQPLGATGSVARISQPALNQTGSVGRLTGNVQRLSPAELGMNVDPSLMSAQGPAPDESMVAQSFAEKHRRGLIALIGFSALLVLGVIGAVAFVVSRSTDEIGGGLGGGTKVIDTSRPEDIVRRQLPPTPGQGSGSAVAQTPTKPKYTGTSRPSNPLVQPENPDDPKGMSLRASEIEDMAAKQGEGTKRCYMRAQKGALGFDIADVKKIAVTLQVGKDGIVSDVQLSSHGGDDFGKCLIARIKAWKFRESSSGGTFRISLAFSNS